MVLTMKTLVTYLLNGIRWMKCRLGAVLIGVAWACLVPTIGLADNAEVSEGDFFRDIPMVYSVSRLPQQPEDASGAITVLDREFIRNTGVREVVDLFRLVPGFSVAWTAGGRPVVAYHGLSGQISQRMQVYIDEQSIYAPYLFGGVDWSVIHVPIEEIERIEIQRGANSVAYGANAFLGVINIITRSPAQSRGWRVEGAKGGNGLNDFGVRWGAGGEHWDGRLLLGKKSDSGLLGRSDRNGTEYFDWASTFRDGTLSEWTFLLRGHAYARETGYSNNVGDPIRDETGSQLHFQFKYRRKIESDQELSISYARSQDRARDPFSIPLLDGGKLQIDNARSATRDVLEWQHFKDLSKKLRMSWGGGVQWTRLMSEQLFAASESRVDSTGRVYLNAEWRPDSRWTVNTGIVYEQGRDSAGQWAPRLSLNWKPAPAHTFKIGYSSAFRTPSLFEQQADWRIQYNGETLIQKYLSRGGLQPEKIRVIDIVYAGKLNDGTVSWDIRLFQENIKRLITGELYQIASLSGDAAADFSYDLRNNASAMLRGGEVSLSFVPWPGATGGASLYRSSSTASKEEIAVSIPDKTVSTFLNQNWGNGWATNLAYSYVSKMQWLGEPLGTGSQRWLQVTQSKQWKWNDARLKWSLGYRKSDWGIDEFRPGQRLPNLIWLGLGVDY